MENQISNYLWSVVCNVAIIKLLKLFTCSFEMNLSGTIITLIHENSVLYVFRDSEI